MRRSASVALILAVGLAGVVTLAGCSSTSSEESGAETGQSQMLPPVLVEQGVTTAEARVGDMIVINAADPVETTLATSTPELVELSQGYDDGSAVFNPGAKALAAGTAVITVTPPDGAAYDLTVTITE